MEKLRECPFCGEKPYYGGYPDTQIRCEQCKQSLVKANWYGGDLGTMEASWNKRIIDIIIIQQADRIKELEEALVEMLVHFDLGFEDEWQWPPGDYDAVQIAKQALKKEVL